jgi:hypothetical protein
LCGRSQPQIADEHLEMAITIIVMAQHRGRMDCDDNAVGPRPAFDRASS